MLEPKSHPLQNMKRRRHIIFYYSIIYFLEFVSGVGSEVSVKLFKQNQSYRELAMMLHYRWTDGPV